MISFKNFLLEAKKKKKEKSRSDRFVWKPNDTVVYTEKEKDKLEEKLVHKGTFEEPVHHHKDKLGYGQKIKKIMNSDAWWDGINTVGKARENQYSKNEKDAKEKHKKFNEIYSEHGKKMPIAAHGAISYYKDMGYEDINDSLRNDNHNLRKDNASSIKHLDHITSHKTTEPFHVYRGFKNHDITHMNKGDIHHDKGYTSASLNLNKGREFGGDKEVPYEKNHEKKIVAKIHVPKGTKGYYLDNDSHSHDYKDEKEFLFHRGTHFKVTGHSHDPISDTHFIHMKVHKQDNNDD